MSPRLHLLSGIPIVIAGVAGSLMVIAVNGWMNHPGGFRIVDGTRRRRAPVARALRQPHVLARARAHVPRRLHRRRLPGRRRVRLGLAARTTARATRRIAIAIPLAAASLAAPLQVVVGDWAARDVGRYQPVKLAAFEGLGTARRRARPSTCSAGTPTGTCASASRCRACSRCSRSTIRTRRSPVSTACRRPISRPSTSSASRSRRWSASARALALAGARGARDLVAPAAAARVGLVLPRARAGGSAVGRRR